VERVSSTHSTSSARKKLDLKVTSEQKEDQIKGNEKSINTKMKHGRGERDFGGGTA